MERKIVHVVGTGTIGEPLIGILCEQKSNLGIDEVTFHKQSPLTKDTPKIKNLIAKGARLAVHQDRVESFKEIGLEPEFTMEEAVSRSSVVIDCTPKGFGHQNKADFYEKYADKVKGFLAQGSEDGFGKKYARGINDHVINSEDQFLQVVSCNTHNIACLVNTIALSISPDNLIDGKFVCLDPYLGTNYHLLSDVKYSKIEVIKKNNPIFRSVKKKYLNDKINKNIKISNFKKFIKHSSYYLPFLKDAKYVGSMFIVRALKLNVEKTDERTGEIQQINKRFISVFSGKWNTCVYVANKLNKLLSK